MAAEGDDFMQELQNVLDTADQLQADAKAYGRPPDSAAVLMLLADLTGVLRRHLDLGASS